MRREIIIAGYGGQGIILAAVITGKAAASYEGKEAAVTENYGPEARGGTCSGTILIDDTKIDYPYILSPDIMVAMSETSYTKFKNFLKPESIILIEDDLVKNCAKDKERIYSIPATRIAEESGNGIVATIVMLGFMTGLTKILNYSSMQRAIQDTVKNQFLELNQRAFNIGFEYGTIASSSVCKSYKNSL